MKRADVISADKIWWIAEYPPNCPNRTFLSFRLPIFRFYATFRLHDMVTGVLILPICMHRPRKFKRLEGLSNNDRQIFRNFKNPLFAYYWYCNMLNVILIQQRICTSCLVCLELPRNNFWNDTRTPTRMWCIILPLNSCDFSMSALLGWRCSQQKRKSLVSIAQGPKNNSGLSLTGTRFARGKIQKLCFAAIQSAYS